jgi:hypothetical protein
VTVFAFGHDDLVQANAQGFRKLVQFVVAVNFDGFLRGVQHDFAVMAPMQVLFQFKLYAGADGPVQVIGQLFKKLSALHG